LLYVFAPLVIAAIGFRAGVVGRRRVGLIIGVSIATCLVVMSILDLDRPRRGLVRINEQMMIDLPDNLRAMDRAL
jgi:hypothetical protein